MKQNQNPLTEWVINKIKTEYPDDIALLVAVEGASVNGDGHGEVFDYFVPATERGNELGQTFIIGGVGNDLYPRSWERTERTASLDDVATQCLGDAKILYSRTKEDEERFMAIRQKLFDNLADPVFNYQKALEKLDVAMNMYRTMMFEERLYRVRALSGYIYRYLTVSVACLNKTYDHWYRIETIKSWKNLPERFVEYYQAILQASTVGEMKSLAHLLIAVTRSFIAGFKPERGANEAEPDYAWFAEWYQEMRTTINRICYYCEIKDISAAFSDAVNMQSELDIISEEFSLGEMDLLGCFNSSDLKPLRERVEELEKKIVAVIDGNGVRIRSYKNLEEFLAAN